MGIFDKIKKEVGKVGDSLDWKKIKVIAGDLHPCDWDFNGGMLTPDPSTGHAECIPLMGEIESLTVETQESVKDMAKTLGLTVAGGVLLGPFGALAGYFAGGDRKQTCVLIKLKETIRAKDGSMRHKQFLAVMDQRIYQQVVALSMM